MTSIEATTANCRCSRIAFVGNIPFNATEEEIRGACELIGPVVSLRLAADGATRKRKGYAFAEYRDDATAQSACRNLHGHHLRGRELRVGLAGRAAVRRHRADHEPVGMEDAIHAGWLVAGRPPAGFVTEFLAAASRHQLRQMVAEFESQGTEACTVIKEKLPWLATAMEQAQNLLGMAAADEAAEESKKKRKADQQKAAETEASDQQKAAAEAPDDHKAKARKMEDGVRARIARLK